MRTKSIRQEIIFEALPSEVYQLLMDETKHADFTGSEVHIQNKEASSFTAYDGYITGTNIRLIEGERIEQDWRAEEDGWPANHFSRVIFSFSRYDGNKTLLVFEQLEIPAHKAEAISKGWITWYWEPMQHFLG